jgi:hypothetical protein
MRYIDDIIRAVESHPYISRVEKQVLIARIEKVPTPEEIGRAQNIVDSMRAT